MAKKTEFRVADAETVIGAGVIVKGTLHSEGDVTIDGDLKGGVKTTGNLTIGATGSVEANIAARNVKVSGQLVGNIKAEGETSISGTGKVKGNIHTGLLTIDHGAVFSGQSFMHESAPPAEVLKNEN